jgi:hypothetical protein
MSLTVVVATRGRPLLADAVRSADELLPVTEFLFVPAPGASAVLPALGAPVRVLDPVMGVYPAWNVAIAATRTSHLILLNDDDVLVGARLDRPVDEDAPTFDLPFRRSDGRSVRSLPRSRR